MREKENSKSELYREIFWVAFVNHRNRVVQHIDHRQDY